MCVSMYVCHLLPHLINQVLGDIERSNIKKATAVFLHRFQDRLRPLMKHTDKNLAKASFYDEDHDVEHCFLPRSAILFW